MIRTRTWATAASFGGLCFALTACNNGLSTGSGGSSATSTTAVVDTGSPLFPPAAMPAADRTAVASEPIVIPNAVVQSDVRVSLAPAVDGTIELIATPLPPGAKYDPKDPEIVFHPRDKSMAFRRLGKNDPIASGQQIARLDEQLVSIQRDASELTMKKCDDSIVEAKKAAAAYEEQLKALSSLGPSASKFERLGLEATVARLRSDSVQTEREKVKAFGEYQTATAQLSRYFLVSPIKGRVTRLLKQPGEYAKAGEPVLELQATERVRIEGKLDAQYGGRVRRGMKVMVEPARTVDPDKQLRAHRQEIAALAVTSHKGRPLVVSGGMDASAIVWDATGTGEYHRLPHPAGVGVRAVACTGPQGKTGNLVATGTDDGKVRLWDLSNPDKLPKEPLPDLDAAHDSAVTAAAFSPDGRFLATAAGRDVYVWSVADRKKMYALPVEHRDVVTSVQFTPQATLVTAARDKSIRVWKVGDRAAASQPPVDHRGGSVDVLGMSSNGGKVLFDTDPGRLDVVSLADERSVGTVVSPTGGPRFATLALFSPDDRTIATVGYEVDQKGELTLWDAPQGGGRGAERRRMVTPRGAPITCAAFSPDPGKRFVAVGTATGGVFVWTVSADERAPSLPAEVVYVQQADARSVLVGVELPNPTDKWGEGLQERSLATIIVDPAAQPAPATAAVIPPVQPTVPANPVVPAGGVLPAAGGIIQAGASVPVVAAPPTPMTPVPAAPPANRATTFGGSSVAPPVAVPPVPGGPR